MTKSLLRVPVHPGEILREEILPHMEWTPEVFADILHEPHDVIEALLKEEGDIDEPLAQKLHELFGNTVQFWLNLQKNYDGIKSIKSLVENE
ncbi:MAG: HigA family addiction module antitoxin [Pseudomonadota bacterium]|nr:HigA family addiction module antitoxin [Pseudomonadota bacterium]